MERLIKVGHLQQYVRVASEQRESAWDLAVQAPTTSAAPRAIINYIHKGPANEKYSSKRTRQRLLHAASVRERISFIQHNLPKGSTRHVDGTITFFPFPPSPPINAIKVLHSHEDAMVLTLGISEFDVRRVLIDPGSSADLLQMPA